MNLFYLLVYFFFVLFFFLLQYLVLLLMLMLGLLLEINLFLANLFHFIYQVQVVKNNDLIFNVKADNKSINIISAIANDTNININQLTNNVSVCVKISYSNNLFFKDFHYKNYIVDCNQKVVNN